MSTIDHSIASLYLGTGIDKLNEILCMDREEAKTKAGTGVRIDCVEEDGRTTLIETPVVLICGATGAGKTTLALQMAFAAARRKLWRPCFCALEQTVQSLDRLADSFGRFPSAVSGGAPRLVGEARESPVVSIHDFAKRWEGPSSFRDESSLVYMCHLSPRPVSNAESGAVFDARLDELRHVVEQCKHTDSDSGQPFLVFFIDSINAFSTEPLARNEIHRLFSLFRSNRVPLIVTMEVHAEGATEDVLTRTQNAKFLADTVIGLSKDRSTGYLQYYLEIEKSRVSRQALGRHLYKIRTQPIARKIDADDRVGIVLYPSIHCVLSIAGEEGRGAKRRKRKYQICDPGSKNTRTDDIYRIVQTKKVRPGACFSIIGPPGAHKLALGMNLATGYTTGRDPSLLIVNLGGTGYIDFRGVAWTESRDGCRELVQENPPIESVAAASASQAGQNRVKFWHTKYGRQEGQRKADNGGMLVNVLTFRIGNLTPEECFYVVDQAIRTTRYSSVLLSDTAELCNGFPLLASDHLFLPALIDLFEARGLVTVCIGVDTGQSARNAGVNYSLSSRADYRIVLSHYPSMAYIAQSVVLDALQLPPVAGQPHRPWNEQLVSLVIDNVIGKHYGREPKWLWVTSAGRNKVLHCGELSESPQIRKLKTG
jgi:KaiC/GvpD/RAD55 family RecA-like ATPase